MRKREKIKPTKNVLTLLVGFLELYFKMANALHALSGIHLVICSDKLRE